MPLTPRTPRVDQGNPQLLEWFSSRPSRVPLLSTKAEVLKLFDTLKRHTHMLLCEDLRILNFRLENWALGQVRSTLMMWTCHNVTGGAAAAAGGKRVRASSRLRRHMPGKDGNAAADAKAATERIKTNPQVGRES